MLATGLLKECGILRRDLAKARAVIGDNEMELVECRKRQAAAEKKAEMLTSEMTDLKLALLQLQSKTTKDNDVLKVKHLHIFISPCR